MKRVSWNSRAKDTDVEDIKEALRDQDVRVNGK